MKDASSSFAQQIDKTTSDYDREKLEERLAKLSGRLALLRAIDALEQEELKCEGDEKTGLQILKHALEVPIRQLAENSGADEQRKLWIRRSAQGIGRSG